MKKFLLPIAATAAISGLLALNWQEPVPTYSERNVAQNSNDQTHAGDKMAWAKVDMSTGLYNPAIRNKVLNEINSKGAARSNSLGLSFVQQGPDNVGGRSRAIIEVYGKPDTMLVGSASGGLYISYDGGGFWERHSQFNNLDSSTSIISAIHQDTTNGLIYVGSGCDFDDQWPGYGIYVSEDDGITFKHLASTTPDDRFAPGSPWTYVHRIRTDGAGNVYAALGNGFKRSTDQGQTWEDVIFLDEAGTIPSSAQFADVLAMKSGRVVASTSAGTIYKSETGESGTFEQVEESGMPSSGMARTVLGYSRQNEDHIYAMFINGSNTCLNSIWETTTGGEVWTLLLEPYDGFAPMANRVQCQGRYDAFLGVSPLDENLFFIGGVEIWRYDGNITRVATEFGGPPFGDVNPSYVHADKHYIYFSPNDERRAYVTSDGGVSVTEDRGRTWGGLNKDFISTQFYSVAHNSEDDLVLGGTQDNGTLIVRGNNANDDQVGFQLTGGDGMGCDVSQVSEIIFTTSQLGVVNRIDASQRSGNNFPVGAISSEGGPFVTWVRLWESTNDPTSKDSIEFSLEPTEIAFEVSNGVVKNYTANIAPLQPNALVVRSSIEVFAGPQSLSVSEDDNTVLVGNGSAEGTISYNDNGSFDIDVTFNTAPTENTPIEVRFEQRFEANSIVYLESENLRTSATAYEFEYRLENDLNPGDIIRVQDPVQSVLAHTGGGFGVGGIRLVRNPMDFNTPATHIDVPGVSGAVTDAVFTKDGNILFVGTSGGTVWRITGIQNIYTEEDAGLLTVENINNFTGGVTGLDLNPNNENHLAVSVGGYNNGSGNVHQTLDALGANPSFSNISGNLAPMPAYAVMIDRENPNLLLIGTEFGLWATEEGDQASPTWVDVNEDLTYVPVYDIQQQGLPWKEAKNSGMIFVGTYGAGLWKSESLLGIEDVAPLADRNTDISGLKVYPNPMVNNGLIEFESSVDGQIDLRVFDINGRLVIDKNERIVRGTNNIKLNTNDLPTGTYYATLASGDQNYTARFMVFK